MIRPNTYDMLRISKPKAKRLYESGMRVDIVPCNFRPDNGFLPASPIPPNVDFETYVRDYSIYNCTCTETGKYPAFYVKDIHQKYGRF